jgi:hypothetical protein
VEPQPPPSSTPPSPSAVPPPPARSTAAQADGATTTSASPDVATVLCPDCGEPRAEAARFCEECGHDYEGNGAAPPAIAEERSLLSGPLLWAVLVFWVVLIVGGLLFLYNALWAI